MAQDSNPVLIFLDTTWPRTTPSVKSRLCELMSPTCEKAFCDTV